MLDDHSIESLSEAIAHNTRKVAEYLRAESLPFPSFDTDAPSESMIPADATEIQKARADVVNDTRKLRDLMLGPRDYLQSFTHDELLSMQAVTRFRIANTFPIHAEVPFFEIAKACGLDESMTRRLLRYAMTKNIFQEPRKGVVSHTAASRLLAEDSQLHDWVGASTDELWQAAAQTINALVKYPGSQEPNQTGFALANGVEKSIYEVFAMHPDRAKRFGNAMASFTAGTGYELEHLINGHDWSSIGSGLVVDVGGSNGFVSVGLASAFPQLRFVVQDFEEVVASANVSSDFKDRIQFIGHDFLSEQPIKNADVYLFRWIFHNWSDIYCVRILRSLIPALKRGAIILINDNVLPEPGTLDLWQEERLRSMDLTMLEIQNSRERELDEWAVLFREADSRFEFLGGTQPTGSRLWILKARWNA